MSDRILDIDHLMVSVTDSQAAGDAFERLGFTLTPRSILPGMSNRLICFQPPAPDRCNFIEFLALDDADQAPQIMSDVLLPPERPVSMVTVSNDVQACAETLRARGLDVPDPLRFKRDWHLPNGEVISPEFIVLIPTFGQAPLYWNVAQYLNPELYRRPEFTKHPNTATGFAGVLAIAGDPHAVAEHFGRMWEATIIEEEGGAVRIGLDNVFLRLLPATAAADIYPGTPVDLGSAAARMIGFAITVADRAVLRALLDAVSVASNPAEAGGLWVGPDAARGCVVHFLPAD